MDMEVSFEGDPAAAVGLLLATAPPPPTFGPLAPRTAADADSLQNLLRNLLHPGSAVDNTVDRSEVTMAPAHSDTASEVSGSSTEDDMYIPGGPTGTPLTSQAPHLLPSWAEVALDPRITVSNIPRGAAAIIAEVYSKLLHVFNTGRTWESLHALWCFPKAVLSTLPSGGRGHWARLGRVIRGRAEAFLKRPTLESWQDGLKGCYV
jgi:hypothetical protein